MGNLFRWQVGCGCGCDSFCDNGLCLYRSNLTGATNFDNAVQSLGRDSAIAGMIIPSNAQNVLLNTGTQANYSPSGHVLGLDFSDPEFVEGNYYDNTQTYVWSHGDSSTINLNNILGAVFACPSDRRFIVSRNHAICPNRVTYATQTISVDSINHSYDTTTDTGRTFWQTQFTFNVSFTQTLATFTAYIDSSNAGFLPDILFAYNTSPIDYYQAHSNQYVPARAAEITIGSGAYYYHNDTQVSSYMVPYLTGVPYRNGIVYNTLTYPPNAINKAHGALGGWFEDLHMNPQWTQEKLQGIFADNEDLINQYAQTFSATLDWQPVFFVTGLFNRIARVNPFGQVLETFPILPCSST